MTSLTLLAVEIDRLHFINTEIIEESEQAFIDMESEIRNKEKEIELSHQEIITL